MGRDRMRVLVLGGCLGLAMLAPRTAEAQSGSRERSVTVTGPGGRTIERQFSASRGGGQVDRQLSIRRPGGSLDRSFHASAPPPGPRPGPPPMRAHGFGGHGHGHGPWFGPPPPPSGPDPLLTFGLGALTGAAVAAPIARMTAPAPVVVASPPMMVVEQPMVVAAPPAVIVEQPAVVAAPPTVVVEQPMVVAAAVDPLDPVALAGQRLQSYLAGTRREAAESLGLLGDPRGVPPLVDALKNDWNSGVRVASATALGRIGGPEAEAVLGRAVVYEKKDAVRDAAAVALREARARSAALAAATPTETIVESRVEPIRSIPKPASSTNRPVPAPPAPRPPAWGPSESSRVAPAPLPLEAPSLLGDETTLDPIPSPPPPPPARG